MRIAATIITSLAMWSVWAAPALAVETNKVYSSGILVLVFLGICALIVVAQLIPALLILMGTIKGMVKGALKGRTAPVEEKNT
jgi:hypothetical protein